MSSGGSSSRSLTVSCPRPSRASLKHNEADEGARRIRPELPSMRTIAGRGWCAVSGAKWLTPTRALRHDRAWSPAPQAHRQRQIRIRVGRAAAAERWVATGRLPVLVLWSFVEREPASRNHLAEVTLSRQFGAGRGDLLMVVSVIVGFVEETSGSARRRMLRPGGLARDR
jgi:hypothetical protein